MNTFFFAGEQGKKWTATLDLGAVAFGEMKRENEPQSSGVGLHEEGSRKQWREALLLNLLRRFLLSYHSQTYAHTHAHKARTHTHTHTHTQNNIVELTRARSSSLFPSEPTSHRETDVCRALC